MNQSDQETYLKRFEILKNLIKEHFPSDEIFEDCSQGRISVSRPRSTTGRKRSPRIDFCPDEDLLTDSNSNFKVVFYHAIQKAKQVLENPPLKHLNFQGKILLTHGGTRFTQRRTNKIV